MQIFDFYQAMLETVIEIARKDGKYDEGIVDVKGMSVTIAGEPEVVRMVGPHLLSGSQLWAHV